MAENPEFLIGTMRVLTMREETFFYVTCQPTAMGNLDKELDLLMPKLEAAQTEAHVGGPIIVRYFPVDTPDVYLMEVGVPVKVGTPSAGEAQVKALPPFRCAALLYWGSLEHVGQAYGALTESIQAAGLEQTGEGREWYYHFEGDASPNNVIGLFMGIR